MQISRYIISERSPSTARTLRVVGFQILKHRRSGVTCTVGCVRSPSATVRHHRQEAIAVRLDTASGNDGLVGWSSHRNAIVISVRGAIAFASLYVSERGQRQVKISTFILRGYVESDCAARSAVALAIAGELVARTIGNGALRFRFARSIGVQPDWRIILPNGTEPSLWHHAWKSSEIHPSSNLRTQYT